MTIIAISNRLFLLLGLVLSVQVAAQPAVSDTEIKAAYLLKFPTYVEWPEGTFAEPDSPLVFGVINDDAVADSLDQLGRGLVVEGHPVTIKHLLAGDTVGDLHILFVGGMTTTVVSGFLQQAVRRPVLTVSETDPSRPVDSVINFTISENKVRFDVALDPAERMGLKLSSRLLQVAHHVIGATP